MPARYVIDVENRVVWATFHGVITYADAAEMAAALAKDSRFDPDFSELADFEEGTDLQLQFHDFRDLSRMDPFSISAKRAFVARSRALYGVLRIYQIMREDSPNVRLFDTLDEAVRWLRVEKLRAS